MKSSAPALTRVRGRMGAALARRLGEERRLSTTCVNVPPATGIGLGNMLYFALWAHAGRRQGLDWSVRSTPALRRSFMSFPSLQALLVEPDCVRFLDRRVQDWAQDFHKFTPSALTTFVGERLLTAPDLATLVRPRGPEVVTVNIRRGDYYSVPEFRARYSFDVAGYVRNALMACAEQCRIARIEIVSDDPSWCRTHLAFLTDFAPVTYPGEREGALQDLASLASARRLVLANSSFSYWGGFLSNAVHGDNHALVWCPGFHERGINESLPYQIDPRWSVVESIPSGWGPA